MRKKLAVLFVHGVEIENVDFAETATRLLKRAFSADSGVDADDVLTIRPAFWAPVAQPYEERLLARLGGERGRWFYDWLDRAGTRVDAGSVSALVAAALSGFVRVLPGAPALHYPTLRWLTIHYVGDAIAYQATPSDSRLYDQVHAVVARSLRELAAAAGPDAPLCVIAHSLGAVIASNYFYDLETQGGVYGDGAGSPVPAVVRREMGDTALERGETLAHLYTLGNPLALWTLRYTSSELDRPLVVPHPRLASHHPGIVDGGWVNVYDPDDVIASALTPLSDDYARAVVDDRRSVGPRLLGWTPLAHPWYWNDPGVMTVIGQALARAWAA
jgi:hypothetical protein